MIKPEIILLFDRLLNKANCGLTISKLYDAGLLVDINRSFYRPFAGQYYQGLPVNYVIHRGHVNWNVHGTDALTLAIGNGATYCSGYLSGFATYDAPESPYRDWVEIKATNKCDYVLEPAWELAIEKSIYYKVFGAQNVKSQSYQAFIEARAREAAATKLYTLDDYEENGVPLDPAVVRYAQSEANAILQSETDPQRRLDAQQLLAALPDLTLCKNLVATRVKRLSHCQRFGKPHHEMLGDTLTAIDPNLLWSRDSRNDREKW